MRPIAGLALVVNVQVSLLSFEMCASIRRPNVLQGIETLIEIAPYMCVHV